MKESIAKFREKMLKKHGAKNLPKEAEFDSLMEEIEGGRCIESLPLLL